MKVQISALALLHLTTVCSPNILNISTCIRLYEAIDRERLSTETRKKFLESPFVDVHSELSEHFASNPEITKTLSALQPLVDNNALRLTDRSYWDFVALRYSKIRIKESLKNLPTFAHLNQLALLSYTEQLRHLMSVLSTTFDILDNPITTEPPRRSISRRYYRHYEH